MSNFNRVILAGNLTRDPDLRYTPNGTAVCSFDLAINSYFKDNKGERKEVATFVPITIWRKQAETTAEFMKKGRPVLIEGRLKQERWTDKEGKNRSRLTVTASIVRFLSAPAKSGDSPPPVEPEPPAEQEDENISF